MMVNLTWLFHCNVTAICVDLSQRAAKGVDARSGYHMY